MANLVILNVVALACIMGVGVAIIINELRYMYDSNHQ